MVLLVWPYHLGFGLAVELFVWTSTSVAVRVMLSATAEASASPAAAASPGIRAVALRTGAGWLLGRLACLPLAALWPGTLPLSPALLLVRESWRCGGWWA